MGVKAKKAAARPRQSPPVLATTTRDPRKTLVLLAGIGAILAGTLAAYAPALQSGYIWDDDLYLVNNQAVQSPDGLAKIWTDPAATPQYYPLVYTLFWTEYRLWGLEPLGFHLINVLLHVATAVLIWQTLRWLKVPGAYLAGAIFALHPVHVESVAWITERKNVLSGLFYVLALLAYLRFDPPEAKAAPAKRPWLWYGASLLLFACALLSKSVTCSLPVILLILIWWKRGRIGRRSLAALGFMLILGVASGLTTAYLEKHQVGAAGETWSLTLLERCLLAGRMLWFYAGKLVWPHPIMFFYPRWTINAHVWWQYLFPLAAVAVVAALWLGRRRIGRGPLAAVLFFVITLAPALGFFDVYSMRYSWVADHFQYLGSVGVIVLLAALLATAASRLPGKSPRVAKIALLVLPAALGAGVWHESLKYKDVETLWRDTIAKNPSGWMAHNNLGTLLWQSGREQEAIEQFGEALKRKHDSPQILGNYGVALHKQGRDSDAAFYWREALRLKPDYAMVHGLLGELLMDQGQTAEGMQHLREFARLAPNDAKGLHEAGIRLLEQKDVDGAVDCLSKAVRLEPNMPTFHLGLAAAYAQKGDHQRAQEEFAIVMRLRPDPMNYLQLASLSTRLGRPDEAIWQLRQALQMKSDYVPAAANLAWLLATCNRADLRNGPEAVKLAQLACEQTGHKDYRMLDALAAAYAESGQFEQAARAAQEAVQCAAASGKEEATGPIRERLKLYEQGQPYHQPAESTTAK